MPTTLSLICLPQNVATLPVLIVPRYVDAETHRYILILAPMRDNRLASISVNLRMQKGDVRDARGDGYSRRMLNPAIAGFLPALARIRAEYMPRQ